MLRINTILKHSMWLLTKILLFYCVLQNILFWPTNYQPGQFTQGIFLITFVLLVMMLPNWSVTKKAILNVSMATAILIFYLFLTSSFVSMIYSAVYYLTGVLIFMLSDKRKQDLLRFVTKFFSLLTIVCLSAYILWLIIGFRPFYTIRTPFEGYTDYQNFIFFLLPRTYEGVPRFSGPFVEPGHYGMLCAFLIFANRYKFKENRYLTPLLLGTLFSLSLAGYVLLVIGYALNKGTSIFKVLLALVVCGMAYLTVAYIWDNGDNPINERILSRLEYDNDKGISGNNRNLYSTDQYFVSMVRDGSIWTGVGTDKFKQLTERKTIGGAGITIFLIRYGIIGLICVALYYLAIALGAPNKKYSLKFLFFIAVCFLQRAYPFWYSWLIPYITSQTKMPDDRPRRLVRRVAAGPGPMKINITGE